MKNLTVREVETLVLQPPDDPNFNLRLTLRHGASVRTLVDVLLHSPIPHARYVVCYTLHDLMANSARYPVLTAIFDEDAEVREAASDTYAKIGHPDDGPILMAAFEQETVPIVRINLVIAFGAIRYQAAAPLLLSLLPDLRYFSWAVWSLGELTGTLVEEGLREALASCDEANPRWQLSTSLAAVELRNQALAPCESRGNSGQKS